MARELANDRADQINPKTLEALAKSISGAHKLKMNVIAEAKLRSQGYHLLPSVGQGAAIPPRLITLEYKGNPKSKDTVALIGKGITFDTGKFDHTLSTQPNKSTTPISTHLMDE
jgi:leucyl aminopeptidase